MVLSFSSHLYKRNKNCPTLLVDPDIFVMFVKMKKQIKIPERFSHLLKGFSNQQELRQKKDSVVICGFLLKVALLLFVFGYSTIASFNLLVMLLPTMVGSSLLCPKIIYLQFIYLEEANSFWKHHLLWIWNRTRMFIWFWII